MHTLDAVPVIKNSSDARGFVHALQNAELDLSPGTQFNLLTLALAQTQDAGGRQILAGLQVSIRDYFKAGK